jgi:hypothetical protein
MRNPKNYTIAEDHRYLVVNTYEYKHKYLAKMWPVLGCIGEYQSSITRNRYKACTKFLDYFLASTTTAITEAEALCFVSTDDVPQCIGKTTETVDPVLYCNGR